MRTSYERATAVGSGATTYVVSGSSSSTRSSSSGGGSHEPRDTRHNTQCNESRHLLPSKITGGCPQRPLPPHRLDPVPHHKPPSDPAGLAGVEETLERPRRVRGGVFPQNQGTAWVGG